MFYFKRITPILFGIPPLKARNDYTFQKFRSHDSIGSPLATPLTLYNMVVDLYSSIRNAMIFSFQDEK